jgi:NADPH:quinone reductase-like Zn-dependent oxidoreductase
MKAIIIEKFGHEDQLHLEEIPTPSPTDNEIQIQILYTSVNPVDWKICEGMLESSLPHEFPIILGWDAAGVVKQIGKNVKKFKIDDEVYAYCLKPTIQWGTYAEFVCFDAENVALKPKNVSFAQAAAIPLVGLTAWQALFDFAKLKKNDSVLIHGGAGGVGGFALQFAKYTGAKIITTASRQNHEYVKELGADYAIDYHQSNFVEEVNKLFPDGLDVVFDTIGGETLNESVNILKPRGRLISIVDQLDPKLAKEKNIQFGFVFVSPNGNELRQISNLIEQKKVFPPFIEEMPLSDVAKAHKKSREGHIRGKIVLKVT